MLKKISALLFVVILLAPVALWIHQVVSPERHKDALEDLPRPYAGALLTADYYRTLDRFINRQFVFREHLQQAKRWIDYRILQRTDHDDVHVGRQGWLYRRIDVENHLQGHCGDDAIVNRLLLDLHAIGKVVQTSGRRFRFLVVPNKASIYPEYLGWVPLKSGGRCTADNLLREAHHDDPLQTRVPLEATMLAHKLGSRLLYDTTGRFWNSRGAAVAAEALYYSLFETRTLAPVLRGSEHRDNLERQILGDLVPMPQHTKRQLAGQATEGLGHCLVYGDAGVERLLPHLVRMAARLTVVSAETVPSRPSDEDWRSFDTILIQVAEADIRDMHFDLDRIYDQLSAEIETMTHTPVALNALRPIAHIALNTVDEGVVVKSVGRRSTFALNDLPGSYRRCFRVLRLNLTALQPDILTVEYRMHPPLRVDRPLHAARFNLYLPLPEKSRVSLRFQPGSRAGLLVLHEAEIIGFPENGADACGRLFRNSRRMEAAGDSASQVGSMASPTNRPLATIDSDGQVAEDIMAEKGADREAISATNVPKTQGDAAANSDDRRSREPPFSAAQQAALPNNAAPAADLVTIALNEFADGRIFQRKNHQADIIVSGVYTGAVTGIEARVVRHDGREEVVPWTVIDAATHNGIYLGVLSGVPEGGWYVLETRTIGPHSIVAHGQNRWGIGILVACIGQSNMKEWFHSGDDLKAHPLLRKHAGKGWEELGGQGNGAITCGNRIIARTGVPVGLLDFAINGAGLHRKADWGTGYWGDVRSGSIYRRFVNAVNDTGGCLEYVIWIQGEADAARGTVTGAVYKAALTRFINRQVRLDIANGSSRPQLPFLVVAMVKRPGGRNAPHQAIREAQHAVAIEVAECYLAATTLDLRNQGKQHLAPEAYTTMGLRVAQTILYILDLENFYRGPSVAAVRPKGVQMLEVSIQHRGGDDITPQIHVTGWEVIDDQGAVPILDVIRHDSQTVRILLERALRGTAEVRYLYGANPDTRRPLLDNATPGLPLEAFRGGLDVNPLR